MALKDDKYYRRRISTSYFTTVISMTLVLFTLGFFGLLMMHAQALSDYIKENISFEIIVNPNVKEADILHLQKQLDIKSYVKSTEYITREEAIKRLAKTLGNDFVQFLGNDDNPLLPSIDVRFNADWANNDSIVKIENRLMANKIIKEVYYQKSLVHVINRNLRKIGLVSLFLSALLLIIAIALINNTIRLTIYSQRFIINGMQLVGATESFIRRPFVVKSIFHGTYSAILALILLTGLITVALENIPELALLENTRNMVILYVSILLLGIIISAVSTWFAVGRYLHLRSDKLHLL